jgi:hypothetical protein
LPPVLTDCLHPNDFDKKTLPQCEVCVTPLGCQGGFRAVR